MINFLKKFFASLRSRGAKNTLRILKERLIVEAKCRVTSGKLRLHKSITKGEVIKNYGEYKFNYYGEGDRAEILYHAFWDKLFFGEKEQIRNFINQGDTVIDVGGNLGFFVLILYELVGAKGKIISFEPSKRLYKKLIKTTRNNHLQNVSLINFGLGESKGNTSLYYNPKQTGLSSMVKSDEDKLLVEEIQITTLDKFSENIKERVSFIKIDTEGYEPQVLKGAIKLIKKDKPVLYIELGGKYWASSIEALKVLKELGYKCKAENLDLKSVPEGSNFIAIPES